MTEIIGDILETKAQWIIHQCNITSEKVKGLALDIFTKYPYANTYQRNSVVKRQIGTVSFHYGHKNIINLYAQRFPGSSRYPNDTEVNRLNWFISGLRQIETECKTNPSKFQSFAFPKYIGCGLAGGQWNLYYRCIQKFASNVNVPVYIHTIKI